MPQHPYALPMKQHGPMKLTYMSAKDFPNIPKYGLIPIPRWIKIKLAIILDYQQHIVDVNRYDNYFDIVTYMWIVA